MPKLRFCCGLIAALLTCALGLAQANSTKEEICPRPQPGSVAPEPANLRSVQGRLKVDLDYRSVTDDHGQKRFCFVAENGGLAPTLRLNPGDELILSLKNSSPPSTEGQHALAHA